MLWLMERTHAKFWWLHLLWKKGRRARQLHYSQTRKWRLLDCRRMHKKINSSFFLGGEKSLFAILRVITAPSLLSLPHCTPLGAPLNADHGHAAAFCALLGLGSFGNNILAMIFYDPAETIFPPSRKIHPFRT